MNTEQEQSPRYWVCHSTESNDIFLTTMTKDRDRTQALADQLLGKGWEEAEYLRIDLIEIKFADK